MTADDSKTRIGLDMDFNEVLGRFAGTNPEEPMEARTMADLALTETEDPIAELLQQFNDCARDDGEGNDCWYARDLMELFGYKDWTNFRKAIARAYTACVEGNGSPEQHFFVAGQFTPWRPEEVFRGLTENTTLGRPREDVILSRGAAYLLAQNCDPKGKPAVAFAQQYFAVQTRKMELLEAEIRERIEYDEKRVMLRDKVAEHNVLLNKQAAAAGVKGPDDFRKFNGAGLQGLYNMTKARLQKRKGLKQGEEPLDHAGHEELAAFYFKSTQAEARLRREKTKGVAAAIKVHEETGGEVREAIRKMGGTMPEDLPTEEAIQKVRKRLGATDPATLEKPKRKPAKPKPGN